MFDPTALIIFMTAALALLLTPGPAVLYIVARSVSQGRLAGIVSTLGIALGSAAHVMFAAFGLSALLMRSVVAFSLVKYVGAAYLIYLGLRTLLNHDQTMEARSIEPMNMPQIFWQGFIVNLLNPKTALFFLSFLPQFVDATRGPMVPQIVILGAIFVAMAILSDSMYALAAGTAGQLLADNPRVVNLQKYLSGAIYIGLGISAALSGDGRLK